MSREFQEVCKEFERQLDNVRNKLIKIQTMDASIFEIYIFVFCFVFFIRLDAKKNLKSSLEHDVLNVNAVLSQLQQMSMQNPGDSQMGPKVRSYRYSAQQLERDVPFSYLILISYLFNLCFICHAVINF